MNTTLMIKLDKGLRNDAKKVAGELGIPLTTIVNAYLKQFVRDKQITVSYEPRPTKETIELLERISAEADKEKNPKVYTDVEELIKDLKLA